jgi:DNA-binding transcriptional MerR regulator
VFQIKEFSKVSGLSMQTLRYYDAINILKPKSTGIYNNYRYYSEEELLRIKAINKLKRMGFKLAEIKIIVNNLDKNQFLKRKKALEKDIYNSQKALKEIKTIINNLNKKVIDKNTTLLNLIINEERVKNMEIKYSEMKDKLMKAYDLYKDKKTQDCYQILEEIKNVIFNSDSEENSFWDDASGSVFTSIALELIRNNEKSEVNFTNISNFKVKDEYYFEKVKEYAEKLNKESYSYLGLKTIITSPVETSSSIMAMFTYKLRPYVIKEL